MKKRILSWCMRIICCHLILLPFPIKIQASENIPSIQENLYEAVNHDWLTKQSIPDNQPAINHFSLLQDQVNHQLRADLTQMMTQPSRPDDPVYQNMVSFYQLATDYPSREKEGLKPLKDIIDQIDAIEDIDDLNQLNREQLLDYGFAPFVAQVAPDLIDSSRYTLHLGALPTLLPDKSYYNGSHPDHDRLIATIRTTGIKEFELLGYSSDEAEQRMDSVIRFDQHLAPYTQSIQEKSVVLNLVNPAKLTDIAKKSSQFDVTHYINTLADQSIDQVNVLDPDYFNHLDDLVNSQTFADFRNFIVFTAIQSASSYLTEELRQLQATIPQALTGTKEARSQDDASFDIVNQIWGPVLGQYYGQKYFGEKARADVTQMVQEMVTLYEKRLAHIEWLSPATREKAQNKLKQITLRVGYPDHYDPEFQYLKIDTGQSFFKNCQTITRIAVERNFAKYGQTVDRSLWQMPATFVNALYHSQTNSITIPAAILQAPFYDVNRSRSENLGAIGVIIGHELSHALDTNGAQFDEKGGIADWWTAADYTAFQQQASKLVDQFDGLETETGKMSGLLTVTENIADNAGMTVALDVLSEETNSDYSEFFKSWATIWASKTRPEMAELLLQTDVHAPNEIRVNVPPQNFDMFYQTFNVNEKDAMYLAPKKRVIFW